MDLSPTHIWIIIATLALIIELVSVSLLFVFFTIGAAFTALLTSLGLIESFNMQLLSFSIVSVLSLLAARQPLKSWLKRNKGGTEYSEYLGDRATVINDIPEQGEGRVFYRGTEWIALSASGALIEKGKLVIIKKLDGIKLIVVEI